MFNEVTITLIEQILTEEIKGTSSDYSRHTAGKIRTILGLKEPPPLEYLRVGLRRLFHEQGHLLEQVSKLIPFHNLPPRDIKFVGRQEELRLLDRLVHTHHFPAGITQQPDRWPRGGIGKTSLALEYAWHHLHRFTFPGGIFWISGTHDSPITQLASLAHGLQLFILSTPEDLARRVKERLEGTRSSLLIIDNLDSAERWNLPEWQQWIPQKKCYRLLTTREPRISGVSMLELHSLSQAEGRLLLALHRTDAAASPNQKAVGKLIDACGGHPSTLAILGAHMARHPDLTWADHLLALGQKIPDTPQLPHEPAPDVQPTDHEKYTAAAFDALYDDLDLTHRRTLDYAALLPQGPINEAWLLILLKKDPDIEVVDVPGLGTNTARLTISHLINCKLLALTAESPPVVTLQAHLRHLLTQRIAQGRATASKAELWKRIFHLAESRTLALRDIIDRKTIGPELLALLDVFHLIHAEGHFKNGAILLRHLHPLLHQLALHTEALTALSLLDTLATRTAIGGKENRILCANLAATHHALGHLPQARAYMETSTYIEARDYGPTHHARLPGLQFLAEILLAMDLKTEALETYKKALAILPEPHTLEHPGRAALTETIQQLEEDLRHQHPTPPEDTSNEQAPPPAETNENFQS